MPVKRILVIVVVSLILSRNNQADAEDVNLEEIGFRFGTELDSEKLSYRTYEIFAALGLPWSEQLYWGWSIRSRFNFSLGAVNQGGDTDFFATLGPELALSHKWLPLIIDGGGGLAFLSDSRIGRQNFGGILQFNAHGGISCEILWNIAIGYRFFHISDAGLFDGHGINRHLIELIYRF